LSCPATLAIDCTAIATGTDHAIARLSSLDTISLNWIRIYQTRLSSPCCQRRLNLGHISNVCHISYAAFAHAASPASGPSTFKADAFTTAAIPTAAITTAVEEATPRGLEFMFALPKAISSQNVLSLLVL
jgi:hypothetical protein